MSRGWRRGWFGRSVEVSPRHCRVKSRGEIRPGFSATVYRVRVARSVNAPFGVRIWTMEAPAGSAGSRATRWLPAEKVPLTGVAARRPETVYRKTATHPPIAFEKESSEVGVELIENDIESAAVHAWMFTGSTPVVVQRSGILPERSSRTITLRMAIASKTNNPVITATKRRWRVSL